MCTALYFDFCIYYIGLTIKSLVSTCRHRVIPFYPFRLSPLVTAPLFSVSICFFYFGFFVCLFLYSTYEQSHMAFAIPHLTYFT